ncbi:MAG: ATP-binding protein [Simkania negevensis]|nr:ATP-binding protein [Simkania negevensis]
MLKRHITQELVAYLKIMPVVLVTGARQTGKTTLLEFIAGEWGFAFVSLDDELSLTNAKRDPSGWLASLSKPLIIDEVQRVPEIFLSIKRDVDQNRHPGRYLLSGSANPLLLPRLGDSLTGRMGIVNMLPFSQGELKGKRETFIEHIFGSELSFENFEPLILDELHTIFLRGGFPSVQSLKEKRDVNRWISSYLQTMMERDVRDIANIEGLREFPRLFKLLATRSGKLLNISEFARSLGMVSMSLHRYIRLLEALYFIYLLPAYFTNEGKRLIKSPKAHLCDTAMMAQLREVDEKQLKNDPSLSGEFLESFVFSELLKQKSWSNIPFEIYHFRDGDYEVDFVLERQDGSIIGIEVKSARLITSQDLRGLSHLKSLSKNRFKRGIVLHLGSQMETFSENLYGLPIQALWSG